VVSALSNEFAEIASKPASSSNPCSSRDGKFASNRLASDTAIFAPAPSAVPPTWAKTGKVLSNWEFALISTNEEKGVP
jgi:hypothetical protein